MSFEIIASGSFNNTSLEANGQVLASAAEGCSPKEFLREVYKDMSIDYVKFHKMDLLCKIGVVLSDALIRELSLDQKEALEEMAVVLNNSTSSLHSDVKHQASVEEGQSSPAIFVYTLPNIVVGEICIKHKIYGENLFLVSDAPATELLSDYAASLFATGKAKQCMVGWVDALDDKWSASLAIIQEGSTENSINSLEGIFSEAQGVLNN